MSLALMVAIAALRPIDRRRVTWSRLRTSTVLGIARHSQRPVRRVTIWFAADAPLTFVIVTYAV